VKLATTTVDFRGYSDRPGNLVRFFEGTGFRFLDLSFYDTIYADSPFLDDRWEGWVADAGEAAAALGFRFCQAHSPSGNLHGAGEEFDVFLRATLRSVEACGRLHIPRIVVHAQDIGGFPSRENRRLNLRRNGEFIARLLPVMERTGVSVLIENSCDRHAPTRAQNVRNVPSTAGELLELIEHVGHPLVHACWDTGHANVQGVDQYQSIVELGPRLKGVHIADNYGDMDSHVAPFQGTTNLDSVMQGLLDAGYQGFFSFESGNILRNGGVWPNYRREWEYRGVKVARLMNVPLELRRQAVALLYQIGRHILTEYGCFEEG